MGGMADAPKTVPTDADPHTVGAGCLYLKDLEAVDPTVLERIVRDAWERRGRNPRD